MKSLEIITPYHPLRHVTEMMVKDVYENQYRARITDFPDTLVALVSSSGIPYCAAGLRFGLPDCFSEVYLDKNIEDLFSSKIGEQVNRSEILEVTGLASNRIGSSFILLREIILHGRECGMKFGVFTITQHLRRTMKATRLPLIEFAPACKSKIPNPDDWGTYYDNNPWVCGLVDTLPIGTKQYRLAPSGYKSETNFAAA